MFSSKYPFCFFSFGGGVQSSAIYLMLLNEPHKLHEAMGEMPDIVLFADTGAETQSTYDCLAEMRGRGKEIGNKAFEIELVQYRVGIIETTLESGHYYPTYPFFVKKKDGSIGMSKRICTQKFKIDVLKKAVRERLGLTGRRIKDKILISSWLGISTDESERMRLSLDGWTECRYPLIELGMDRSDCIDYCKKFDWHPAKSRCWLCPFQSNINWLDLKLNHPDEFEKACEEDERIRYLPRSHEWKRNADPESEFYLHRSCIPLRKVDFLHKEKLSDFSFRDECTGLCGN